jgi:hypothetical protein
MKSLLRLSIALSASLSISLGAQPSKPVDFSDLTRGSSTSTRTFPVEGIRDESFKYLRNFAGSDDEARAGIARRASEARSNPSPSGSSGSSSSSSSSSSSRESVAPAKAAPAEKVYVCTIYCNSSGGPTITRKFSVKTRSEAAKQAGDQADQYCQAAGYARSSSRSFPENQCREG